MELSALQTARYAYRPKLPPVLQQDIATITAKAGNPTESIANQKEVLAVFPKTYGSPIISFENGTPTHDVSGIVRVGVILSGGQAPGGHNVITGIYDGLKKANKNSVLIGFLGGPAGIMHNKSIEFDDATIDAYRNTGGFDIIGSGRDKIEKPEQFDAALKTASDLKLDAVVVIGGDDSNTNAALLAEDFLSKGSTIQVIGVPKTIDGDLKNEYIETSFGFDTACKTYSELIGNIMRDCNSAKKYWHFIKLMGRSASHIGLECALQTRPNICLISEEVEAKAQSLSSIVEYIADVVAKRSEKGLNYGVALIPEGLVEFIPEIKALIKELNHLLAEGSAEAVEFAAKPDFDAKSRFIASKLSKLSSEAYLSLPAGIRAQLTLDRDPHGNVQVSLIETEKLLGEMVKAKLDTWKAEGKFKGKFNALSHFFGYEGRCAFPSNFDADYCYSLGFNAFNLIAAGFTGYLSSIRGVSKTSEHWIAGGIPLTMMMNMEERHGSLKPVIRKALVELDAAPFKEFARHRDTWARENSYVFPGAIQYFGPSEVCDQPTFTLKLEQRGN